MKAHARLCVEAESFQPKNILYGSFGAFWVLGLWNIQSRPQSFDPEFHSHVLFESSIRSGVLAISEKHFDRESVARWRKIQIAGPKLSEAMPHQVLCSAKTWMRLSQVSCSEVLESWVVDSVGTVTEAWQKSLSTPCFLDSVKFGSSTKQGSVAASCLIFSHWWSFLPNLGCLLHPVKN